MDHDDSWLEAHIDEIIATYTEEALLVCINASSL